MSQRSRTPIIYRAKKRFRKNNSPSTHAQYEEGSDSDDTQKDIPIRCLKDKFIKIRHVYFAHLQRTIENNVYQGTQHKYNTIDIEHIAVLLEQHAILASIQPEIYQQAINKIVRDLKHSTASMEIHSEVQKHIKLKLFNNNESKMSESIALSQIQLPPIKEKSVAQLPDAALVKNVNTTKECATNTDSSCTTVNGRIPPDLSKIEKHHHTQSTSMESTILKSSDTNNMEHESRPLHAVLEFKHFNDYGEFVLNPLPGEHHNKENMGIMNVNGFQSNESPLRPTWNPTCGWSLMSPLILSDSMSASFEPSAPPPGPLVNRPITNITSAFSFPVVQPSVNYNESVNKSVSIVPPQILVDKVDASIECTLMNEEKTHPLCKTSINHNKVSNKAQIENTDLIDYDTNHISKTEKESLLSPQIVVKKFDASTECQLINEDETSSLCEASNKKNECLNDTQKEYAELVDYDNINIIETEVESIDPPQIVVKKVDASADCKLVNTDDTHSLSEASINKNKSLNNRPTQENTDLTDNETNYISETEKEPIESRLEKLKSLFGKNESDEEISDNKKKVLQQSLPKKQNTYWTYEKNIQMYKLMQTLRISTPKDREKSRNLFKTLFGDDSDEEHESELCESDYDANCIERITPWVVQLLMPYYTRKRIIGRNVFKCLGRHICELLIANNSYPSFAYVRYIVQRFFRTKKNFECEADVWCTGTDIFHEL